MHKKISSDNRSTKNKAIESFGKVLVIFGAAAYIASDFIRSFQLPDSILMIYFMAPMGVSLILYARRHQLKNFIQEVKRDGFTKTMENFARRHENFEGKIITDPLAEKTRWSPVKPSSVQLQMRLHVKDNRFFYISYSRYSFYQALVITSILIVFISSPYWALPLLDHSLPANILWIVQEMAPYFLVFGLVPIALAMMPFFATYAETTVDVQKRILEQTRPWFSLRRPILHATTLNKIYAIQLLGYKRNSGSNNSMDVRYEMNLVLNDAERINLMSSYSREELQGNGEKLASGLALPLWDKTHIIYDEYKILMQSLDDQHK